MIRLLLVSFLLMPLVSLSDASYWNTLTGKWGAGVSLGSPTGINGIYFLNEVNAIDAMIGYDFDGNFNLHSDYIFNYTDAYKIDRLDMNFSYGGGIRIKNTNSEFLFGPRAMVATSHYLEKIPLEIGFEFAGIFSIVEKTDFDIEALLNIRYFF